MDSVHRCRHVSRFSVASLLSALQMMDRQKSLTSVLHANLQMMDTTSQVEIYNVGIGMDLNALACKMNSPSKVAYLPLSSYQGLPMRVGALASAVPIIRSVLRS